MKLLGSKLARIVCLLLVDFFTSHSTKVLKENVGGGGGGLSVRIDFDRVSD